MLPAQIQPLRLSGHPLEFTTTQDQVMRFCTDRDEAKRNKTWVEGQNLCTFRCMSLDQQEPVTEVLKVPFLQSQLPGVTAAEKGRLLSLKAKIVLPDLNVAWVGRQQILGRTDNPTHFQHYFDGQGLPLKQMHFIVPGRKDKDFHFRGLKEIGTGSAKIVFQGLGKESGASDWVLKIATCESAVLDEARYERQWRADKANNPRTYQYTGQEAGLAAGRCSGFLLWKPDRCREDYMRIAVTVQHKVHVVNSIPALIPLLDQRELFDLRDFLYNAAFKFRDIREGNFGFIHRVVKRPRKEEDAMSTTPESQFVRELFGWNTDVETFQRAFYVIDFGSFNEARLDDTGRPRAAPQSPSAQFHSKNEMHLIRTVEEALCDRMGLIEHTACCGLTTGPR